jgi:hypothetical protein
MNRHNALQHDERSGLLLTGSDQSLHLLENTSFRYFRTGTVKWAGALSCWKHVLSIEAFELWHSQITLVVCWTIAKNGPEICFLTDLPTS